jgi:hypothetical protein
MVDLVKKVPDMMERHTASIEVNTRHTKNAVRLGVWMLFLGGLAFLAISLWGVSELASMASTLASVCAAQGCPV